jgi:hypothetical protein
MSAINAALTEEVADVEAVAGGPVAVAFIIGRRRLLPPLLATDLEHLRVPGRRRGAHEEGGGGGAEKGANDYSGRERDASAHCPADGAAIASCLPLKMTRWMPRNNGLHAVIGSVWAPRGRVYAGRGGVRGGVAPVMQGRQASYGRCVIGGAGSRLTWSEMRFGPRSGAERARGSTLRLEERPG